MMKLKSLAFIFCIFMSGCSEASLPQNQMTEEYLLSHLTVLQQQVTLCEQMPAAKEKTSFCKTVMHLATIVDNYDIAYRSNQSEFGLHLLHLQMEVPNLVAAIAKTKQTLAISQKQDSSSAKTQLLEQKLSDLMTTYQNKQLEIKLMLSVIGRYSPV